MIDYFRFRCLHTLTEHSYLYVKSVAITPDSSKIISAITPNGTLSSTIKIWDISTGNCLHTFTDLGYITSVAVTPDSSKFVARSKIRSDYTNWAVTVWDIAAGNCLHTLPVKYGGWSDLVALAIDGTRIVSTCGDNSIKIWDTLTGICLHTIKNSDELSLIAVTPDGTKILGGSYQTIKIWDIITGTCLQTFTGDSQWVLAVAMTPDKTKILSGTKNATIKVWDIATGNCLHTLTDHSDWVTSLAVTPDGKKFVSGSRGGLGGNGRGDRDNVIKIWDIPDSCLDKLRDRQGKGKNLNFWIEKFLHLSKYFNRNLSVSQKPYCLYTMSGRVKFEPVIMALNGTKVIVPSYENTIRIWDIATGECIGDLAGHLDEINSVAVTADGSKIVSCSHDNTIKIWGIPE